MPAGPDTRRLRVAQLIETLTTGGAERLAVHIANARAAAGDESHVYALKSLGPMADHAAPGVTVHDLDYERAPVGNPFAFAASIRRGRRLLLERLRADRPDVMQTHLPGANFWGLLMQWAGAVPVVPTIHNNREFDYGDLDHPLRARFRRRAYREMMRRCPAVVAVSDLVRDSMIEQLGLDGREAATIVVVPNGVPLPEPLTDEAREALRREAGCPEGVPLLLAAGRHTEQKNFAALIDAAALLRDRGRDFRLVIAGDGDLLSAHKTRVADRDLDDLVSLPGNVADLGARMQAADVFVMSSLWEGLPLVLLEAMGAGCAVVSTRIAGMMEVLDDGVTGRLVEPGDPAALAAGLDDMIGDPELRTRCAGAARDLVAREYSFARVDRDLDTLYRRILNDRTEAP